MKLSPSKLYQLLISRFGNLNWWPMDGGYHEKNSSDPRFEIIIGAILTQNTAWINVEKALGNIKSNNMLDIRNIKNCDIEKIQEMIKPAGFFNQKAKRLKNIALYLHHNYKDDLDIFFERDLYIIRKELLSLNGIGPETADSILLYAGHHPIFVVDAYTKRICRRLPFKVNYLYDNIQNFFERNLSDNFSKTDIVQIYNEFHALIVYHGKRFCKKKHPDCCNCPLNSHCMYNKKLLE